MTDRGQEERRHRKTLVVPVRRVVVSVAAVPGHRVAAAVPVHHRVAVNNLILLPVAAFLIHHRAAAYPIRPIRMGLPMVLVLVAMAVLAMAAVAAIMVLAMVMAAADREDRADREDKGES
jgi:hypothetical protein